MKIGDSVKVCTNLLVGQRYGSCVWTEIYHKRWAGYETTIKDTTSKGNFYLKGIDAVVFSEQMLILTNNENKLQNKTTSRFIDRNGKGSTIRGRRHQSSVTIRCLSNKARLGIS